MSFEAEALDIVERLCAERNMELFSFHDNGAGDKRLHVRAEDIMSHASGVFVRAEKGCLVLECLLYKARSIIYKGSTGQGTARFPITEETFEETAKAVADILEIML